MKFFVKFRKKIEKVVKVKGIIITLFTELSAMVTKIPLSSSLVITVVGMVYIGTIPLKLPTKKKEQFWYGYNYEDIAYYSATHFHCTVVGVYTVVCNLGIKHIV